MRPDKGLRGMIFQKIWKVKIRCQIPGRNKQLTSGFVASVLAVWGLLNQEGKKSFLGVTATMDTGLENYQLKNQCESSV